MVLISTKCTNGLAFYAELIFGGNDMYLGGVFRLHANSDERLADSDTNANTDKGQLEIHK